jgi:hypothetical protein
MLGEVLNYKDYRIMALELADEGFTTFENLALMCLKYMSQDDVKDMLRVNEFDEIMEEYGL